MNDLTSVKFLAIRIYILHIKNVFEKHARHVERSQTSSHENW